MPTFYLLAKRGVPLEGICPRCSHKPETMVHALWGCQAVVKVREKLLSLKAFKLSDDLNFYDFMFICLRSLNTCQVVHNLGMVFWKVWYGRKQVVHNLGMVESGDVVEWAYNFLDEWQSVQLRPKVISFLKMDKRVSSRRWHMEDQD
ncbi:hypothetical protein Ddye_006530 [Dipteronia dyeriana]|uniref:Reverse transcriptase zinc-binding domain-containing protein n=1 Tax=Dipteronia dyeriana TaxID=168575 RepID=A0AAE0CQS1_9ROSI|nr:hypothetical protein Ddye_006530 [Dipteronia dyeriana]